jgi:hypothetical protein
VDNPAKGADPTRWWRRAWFVIAVSLAVYVALATLKSIDVWAAPLSRYVGEGDDALQSMWFLSWTAFAATHLHNPLISYYMNYPQGFNLMWQTAVPAAGLLLTPITLIWGPIVSYNVAMTGGVALAAWFAFIALRRFVPGTFGPWVGGLVYGFSPQMIAQSLGHTHVVLSALAPPLALILLYEAVVRQRRHPVLLGVMIGGLGVFQFFVSQEFFVDDIIAGVALLGLWAVTHRSQIRARTGYALKVFTVAAVLTGVVLAYPAALQVFGPDRPLPGPIHDPAVFSTDLLNPIIPTDIQWVSPSWTAAISQSFTANHSEWNGYFGITLILMLVVVLVRFWRNRMIRVAGLFTVMMLVLSFGPYLHIGGHDTGVPGPWWPIAHVPLLEDIQPNRLPLFAFLAAGLGIAFLLQRVGSSRAGPAAAIAVAGVALLPLMPKVPMMSFPVSVPGYFASSDVTGIPDQGVVATVPWPIGNMGQSIPLLWQATSGMRFRLLGGYFLGPTAPGAELLQKAVITITRDDQYPNLDSATRSRLEAELRQNNVVAVVVGPYDHEVLAVQFFSDVLGFAPQSYGDIHVWLLTARQ